MARKNDGQVILLRNALPGEYLHYTVTGTKKGTLFGHAHEIVEPHQNRIAPPCPYYGVCGGCDLQHCSYAMQQQIKHAVLTELFTKITDTIQPLIPSPQEFEFRQRIRLHTRAEKVGFKQFRSSEVIPIKRCLLAHPCINNVLFHLLSRDEFRQLCKPSTEIDFLFNPAADEVSLLFHFTRRPRPTDHFMAEQLTSNLTFLAAVYFKGVNYALMQSSSNTDGHNSAKLFSQQLITPHRKESFTLTWEIGGFCQVNLEQNVKLIDFVLQQCGTSKDLRLLDLFCGMGNFSIPLAKNLKSITGVEGQASSVRCAKLTSKRENLTNTTFLKGNIGEVCRTLCDTGQKFDITIVDPPRQGIPGLAPLVDALTVQKLIYVSCDPATLIRDIKELMQNNFTLKLIQPFDMFPQTHHVETIVILEKH